MRLLHRFLWWLPPASFGTAVLLLGLWISAAQLWPRPKALLESAVVWVAPIVTAPLFYLCLAVGLVAWVALVWLTNPLRAPAVTALHPTMPLYLVMRHIARDSRWAAKFEPTRDSDWLTELVQQMRLRLTTSAVSAWGTLATPGRGHDVGPTEIPATFWAKCEISAHEIILSPEPPTEVTQYRPDGAFSSPISYQDVRFDRAQVFAVWPRRSALAALLRCSPSERTLAAHEWRKIDAGLKARGAFIRPGDGWREPARSLDVRSQSIVYAVLERLRRKDPL